MAFSNFALFYGCLVSILDNHMIIKINMHLVAEWILNTQKNVRVLERHVGQKVHQFVSEYERTHNGVKKEACEHNVHLLDDPLLIKKYSKVAF